MRIYGIFALKTYIVMALAVVTFSQFVAELFSRIIPATLYGFFRDAGGAIILAVIFVFAFAWFFLSECRSPLQNCAVGMIFYIVS